MKAIALFCALTMVGCGDCGKNKADPDAALDANSGDAAPDAACFTNPTTHEQIINACTDSQKIVKPGKPPLLNPDGSLPPLP